MTLASTHPPYALSVGDAPAKRHTGWMYEVFIKTRFRLEHEHELEHTF